MKNKAVYIGVFGRRNQGKSSLVNALVGQPVAIVSEIAGTTTDPVKKSMEIFGIGPVVIVDTAGLDDDSVLGEKRMLKTQAVLSEIDLALMVFSGNVWKKEDAYIVAELKSKDVPFLIVHNKADSEPLSKLLQADLKKRYDVPILDCSALQKEGIESLVKQMVNTIPTSAYASSSMVEGIVNQGDIVALVMPQDAEAPEGRLILPQVQMIRDLLDVHAIVVSVQTEELPFFLEKHRPHMVITDSQVFPKVQQIVPLDIPLTSFSILLSKAKGNFELCLKGTPYIDFLKDGDCILMLESCTHISSCEDIGRVKIPRLLQKYTGKQLYFDYVSALDSLPDLSKYAMAIQCGACMVTKRQIANRLKIISTFPLPISNYGMCIAYVTGIFQRVTTLK